MSIRDLHVTEFNGHSLETNYIVRIPESVPPTGEADVNYAPQYEDWPMQSGKTLKERSLPLSIEILSGGSADELLGWFDPALQDEMQLVAEEEDGTEWYLMASTKKVPTLTDHMMNVELEVGDPVWRSVTPIVESWTVTSSGSTHVVNNPGPQDAYPIIRIKPQAVKGGGYNYSRFVTTYNQTDNAGFTMVNVVRNGSTHTLDHAALVTAGKALASGNDFRVMDGSKQLYRYAGGGGWNSTTLKVFTYLYYSPRCELTLANDINIGDTVTEIEFEQTALNYSALQRLKTFKSKLLLIDDEVFTFGAASEATWKATDALRAQRFSAAGGHSAGATVRWLEHDLNIIYGNASATAPSVPTGYQPMFDLATSTDWSHVYSNYYDPAYPNRPGAWRGVVESSKWNAYGGDTNVYTANHNTDSSGVASEMGLRIASFNYLSKWQTEQAVLYWQLNNSFGSISAITFSAERYKLATATVGVAGLQEYYQNVWRILSAIVAPTANNVWQSIGPTTVSLTAPSTAVRFYLNGTVNGIASNLLAMEYDSVTVAHNSNYVPMISMGAENSEYNLNMYVTNSTTVETLHAERTMKLVEELEINCDEKSVFYEANTDAYDAMRWDSDVRRVWMHLQNGDNTVRVVETGLTDVDIEVEFERRMI
jgi:hypothetical protein